MYFDSASERIICPACKEAAGVDELVCPHCGFPFSCDITPLDSKHLKTRRELWRYILGLTALIFWLTSAVVLGLHDYFRKTGHQKAVVGLSGGVDSSLVAAVAVDALGAEHVVGVSMPSRYSSEGSIADAQGLAKNLGIELQIIPIEPGHAAFQEMLEQPFEGTAPGAAEENVQARIRGNLLMTLSNKFGWMVLTTGNKSEIATGYCTLYGDMAGGFALSKD
ncbi:NAD(+) synthase, partial [bacterium]|nr:NAD(+) synthase [bacterium]